MSFRTCVFAVGIVFAALAAVNRAENIFAASAADPPEILASTETTAGSRREGSKPFRITAESGDPVAVGAAVSLTLIPPSPVTDKIILDVRGAARNTGQTAKTIELAFYLDEEMPAGLLHREKIEVTPQSAAGVKFRWPTAKHAGKRKIIMVTRDGHDIRRVEQPLEILDSPVRSTNRLGGAWAGFYHWSESEGRPWNAEIKKMTDDQWGELTRAMHNAEMDVFVIQEVFRNQQYVDRHAIERDGYKGKAFYPSALYPGRMPIAASDPVEAVLSEADKLRMHVFVGVGIYAWFDFSPDSLVWHKKVADELWKRYGHHPSFYGWYVSEEIAGNLGATDRRRDHLVAFFRGFTAHVRRFAPDKPVMLATNCHGIRQSGDYYPKLLANLDILCPFGFHRMSASDMTGEEAVQTLQKYCDQSQSHLWMDMESFVFGAGRGLYPRPITGLLSDLKRFPSFEKILHYQFPGLWNSPDASIKPGGPATVRLYQDYKKYLEYAEMPTATAQDTAISKPNPEINLTPSHAATDRVGLSARREASCRDR